MMNCHSHSLVKTPDAGLYKIWVQNYIFTFCCWAGNISCRNQEIHFREQMSWKPVEDSYVPGNSLLFVRHIILTVFLNKWQQADSLLTFSVYRLSHHLLSNRWRKMQTYMFSKTFNRTGSVTLNVSLCGTKKVFFCRRFICWIPPQIDM